MKTQPKKLGAIFSLSALLLSLSTGMAQAGDPFRQSSPRPISANTEAAFKTIFEKGNYTEALKILDRAIATEKSDPMPYALKASLTYSYYKKEEDPTKKQAYLAEVKKQADQSLKLAEKLVASDPLRGNLYVAVGHFLQGAYSLGENDNDLVRNGPQVLTKLKKVFDHLDKAEKINSNDPELNLIKGYMDLILAVNLPFSNPDQAISRLEKAAPNYLAYRGLAVGYRDLGQYDKAMEYVERARKITPNNPELDYLKGQLFYKKGEKTPGDKTFLNQAVQYFNLAIAKESQLLPDVAWQLRWEWNRATREAQGN